ncbi:uncharacterized protein RSE6_04641 [Rhynchosporium secalis]|uniref:Uncharacterized protein n=1 Tax=Rhynchosporium secalis TaxID=38038 RepID=A0A1E1M5W1_RHYSE|nr:uncharacterized protein RSE6_04641 [Rhynchosporium secalis]
MRSSAILFSLIAGLWESTSAQAPSPSTKSICYTVKGIFPVISVKNYQQLATNTVKLVETTTYTPSVTTIAPPVTVTTTFTQPSTFTLSQITDTYTATEYTGTIVTVSSAVATSTEIVTSEVTSTTTVAVTELPTPDGFKPVQSTLPGAGKKRDLTPISRIKRAVSTPLKKRTFSICPALSKKGAKASSRFSFLHPMSVTCYKVFTVYTVNYVTKTAKIFATVTLPPDVVIKAVTAIDNITTAVPNASFTTTVYLSSDVTITTFYTASTTTTTTVTATETRALTTAYAACRAENIAGGVNDEGIWEVHTSSGSAEPANIPYTNATTATDCCTSCFTNPDCASYVYQEVAPGGQQCLIVLLAPGMCKVPGSFGLGINTGGGYRPGEGYTVGNGYCGAVTGLNDA